MQIHATLPALRGDAIGTRRITVDAATLAQALDQLRAKPRLGPPIFDDGDERGLERDDQASMTNKRPMTKNQEGRRV